MSLSARTTQSRGRHGSGGRLCLAPAPKLGILTHPSCAGSGGCGGSSSSSETPAPRLILPPASRGWPHLVVGLCLAHVPRVCHQRRDEAEQLLHLQQQAAGRQAGKAVALVGGLRLSPTTTTHTSGKGDRPHRHLSPPITPLGCTSAEEAGRSAAHVCARVCVLPAPLAAPLGQRPPSQPPSQPGSPTHLDDVADGRAARAAPGRPRHAVGNGRRRLQQAVDDLDCQLLVRAVAQQAHELRVLLQPQRDVHAVPGSARRAGVGGGGRRAKVQQGNVGGVMQRLASRVRRLGLCSQARSGRGPAYAPGPLGRWRDPNPHLTPPEAPAPPPPRSCMQVSQPARLTHQVEPGQAGRAGQGSPPGSIPFRPPPSSHTHPQCPRAQHHRLPRPTPFPLPPPLTHTPTPTTAPTL